MAKRTTIPPRTALNRPQTRTARRVIEEWLDRFNDVSSDRVAGLLCIDRDALRTIGYDAQDADHWIAIHQRKLEGIGIPFTEGTKRLYGALAIEMGEARASEIWRQSLEGPDAVARTFTLGHLKSIIRGRQPRGGAPDREPSGQEFLDAGCAFLGRGSFGDATGAFAHAKRLGHPISRDRHMKLIRAALSNRVGRAHDLFSHVAHHNLRELVPACVSRAIADSVDFRRLSRILNQFDIRLPIRDIERLLRGYARRKRWRDAAAVMRILVSRSRRWRTRSNAYNAYRAGAVADGDLTAATEFADIFAQPLMIEELFRIAIHAPYFKMSEESIRVAVQRLDESRTVRRRRKPRRRQDV